MLPVIMVIFLLILAAALYISNYSLKVTSYTYAAKDFKTKARAVLIADLHNKEYGKNNSRLLRLIGSCEPDVIFACGDIFGRNAAEKDVQTMLGFLESCSGIAPTLFVRGNHETGLIYSDFPDLLDRCAKVCTVLNDSRTEIALGGTRITVGGTKGTLGYLQPDGQSFPMLQGMLESGLPMIIMSHKPDAVTEAAAAKSSGALFVSGHTHGGLWRLPFVGGMIARGRGCCRSTTTVIINLKTTRS